MYINKNESVLSVHLLKQMKTCFLRGGGLDIQLDNLEGAFDIVIEFTRMALQEGVRIHIQSVDEEVTDLLLSSFHNSGLADFVLLCDNSATANSTLVKIKQILSKEEVYRSVPDQTMMLKNRAHYLHLVKRLQNHFRVLHQTVLGEKRMIDILSRWNHIRSKLPKPHYLSSLTHLADLQLNTEEYLKIYEIVKRGATLYPGVIRYLHVFEEIHPVLFNMFSQKEAEEHLFDTISQALERIGRLRTDLSEWLVWYEMAYIRMLNASWQQLKGHWAELHLELDILEERSKEKKKGLLKMFSNEKGKAEQQILARYRALQISCNNYPVKGLISLPDMKDIKSLAEEAIGIEDLFSKEPNRAISRYVETRMGRLTLFNIDDQLLDKATVKRLVEELKAILHRVKEARIFLEVREDNHMYIYQKLQFIDTVFTQWQELFEKKNHFEDYYKWQQFIESLKDREKAILLALRPYDVHSWVLRFEMWYYQRLIALHLQDTPSTEVSTFNALLKSYRDYRRNLLGLTCARTGQRMLSVIMQLLKEDKKLARLLEKGEGIPLLPAESLLIDQLVEVFPVMVNRSAIDAPHPIIHIGFSDTSKDEVCLQIKMPGKEKSSFTRQGFTISYPGIRSLEKGIIRAVHSERWKSIKRLAGYVKEFLPEARLYENPDAIVLSTVPNKMLEQNALLRMGKDWVVTIVGELSEQEVAERLLDTRVLFSVLSFDGLLFEARDNEEVIWNAHLLLLLDHVGVKLDIIHSQSICEYQSYNPKQELDSEADPDRVSSSVITFPEH